MPVVEKNDVDISQLFSWSRESVIKGIKSKDVKVWVRLLGDADTNKVRVMSLRKSAELRRSLRDLESDDRIAFIPLLEELDKDSLVESVLIFTMRDLTKQAMRGLTLRSPKEPGSDATTEQHEKFQREVDEYPKKREDAIKSSVETLIEKRRKELQEQDPTELYKLYTNVLINELCEQELLKRYKEYCVYFGTYSNKKLTQRFFNSFEDVDNLPTEIKESLINEYSLLEIETEQLKK